MGYGPKEIRADNANLREEGIEKSKRHLISQVSAQQFQGGFFRYILTCLEYKIYIHLLRL